MTNPDPTFYVNADPDPNFTWLVNQFKQNQLNLKNGFIQNLTIRYLCVITLQQLSDRQKVLKHTCCFLEWGE